MVWGLVAVLVAIVALLIALYRRALNEANSLYALLILALLNDEVCTGQKAALLNLIGKTTAKTAPDLALKIHAAMFDHATQVKAASPNAAVSTLWQTYRDTPVRPQTS